MSFTIEEFDITDEATGHRFCVEVTYDDWMGAPQEAHDGHGVVVEMDFDPSDEDKVDERLTACYDDDDPLVMELRARYALMVELRAAGRDDGVYYDVWDTLKIAKRDGWGMGAEWDKANPDATPDERVMAAVQRDAEYLRGWYNDDWHWACVCVTPYDPESEDDELLEGYTESLGGVEHGLPNSDEHIQQVARELVQQCLHEMAKDGVPNPVGLVGAA